METGTLVALYTVALIIVAACIIWVRVILAKARMKSKSNRCGTIFISDRELFLEPTTSIEEMSSRKTVEFKVVVLPDDSHE